MDTGQTLYTAIQFICYELKRQTDKRILHFQIGVARTKMFQHNNRIG